jgi:glycosyltransferase involved in cell wall biosynthesis
MNRPFVSVIIPTFNRAHTLQRCISSVLQQSYKNFELIIVNDGSTDETEEVLKAYSEQIILLQTENRGVSAARNYGIENAQGDWIAFLDSDDEWLEHKLIRQIEYLNENLNLRWLHCDEIWIRNGKRVNPKKKHAKPQGDVYLECLPLCCVSPSAVFIEKKLLNEVKAFREDFRVCEDYDLWLKLAQFNSIGYVPEQLVIKYGGHADQLSHSQVGMDHYRLISLVDRLNSGELCDDYFQATLTSAQKRYEILLQGYLKHEHPKKIAQLKADIGHYAP